MGKAYSDDLRCKILQTYVESDLGQEEVAEQFCVSYGYVKKIRRQQLQSGQMERKPQIRYGPVSLVTPQVEEQLRSEVRKQPDVTLLELAQRLEQSRGSCCANLAWGKCWSSCVCGVKKTLHAAEQDSAQA